MADFIELRTDYDITHIQSKLLKVYWKTATVLITKKRNADNSIVSELFDFTHIDTNRWIDVSNPDSSTATIIRFETAPLHHRRYLTVLIGSNTIPADEPQLDPAKFGRSRSPYKNVRYNLDRKVTFPEYLYIGKGETETEETNVIKPDWGDFHARPKVAAEMKQEIGRVAHFFLEGFDSGWLYLFLHDGSHRIGYATTNHEDWQEKAAECYVTAMNWARLLIGWGYREADRHGRSTKAQNGKELRALTQQINEIKSQIPTPFTVQEFMNRCRVNNWKEAVSNTDKDGTRRVYTRRANWNRGKLLYDINANNLKADKTVDHTKAAAEYMDILHNFYKAFKQPHPDAERVVTREFF